MSKFDDHPTVKKFREQNVVENAVAASPIDADWLRHLCLEAGADDVEFNRLSDERLLINVKRS